MAKERKQYPLKIPSDLYTALQEVAKREHRSVNDQIAKIINDHLREYLSRPENRRIRDRLAQQLAHSDTVSFTDVFDIRSMPSGNLADGEKRLFQTGPNYIDVQEDVAPDEKK